MSQSIRRQVIEELAALTKRAQSIALHQYSEMGLPDSLPVHDRAYAFFLAALHEKREETNPNDKIN